VTTEIENGIEVCSWCREPASSPANGCAHLVGHWVERTTTSDKALFKLPWGIEITAHGQSYEQCIGTLAHVADLLKKTKVPKGGLSSSHASGPNGITNGFILLIKEPVTDKVKRLRAEADRLENGEVS
jgi:hypothetical protein